MVKVHNCKPIKYMQKIVFYVFMCLKVLIWHSTSDTYAYWKLYKYMWSIFYFHVKLILVLYCSFWVLRKVSMIVFACAGEEESGAGDQCYGSSWLPWARGRRPACPFHHPALCSTRHLPCTNNCYSLKHFLCYCWSAVSHDCSCKSTSCSLIIF